jgi:nucleoside-diphosphate-sugar epimerase
MIVAVTGAGGIVGRFLLPQLQEAGHQVRPQVRRAAARPSGVAPFVGSLPDPELAGRLLDGADALVHCALEHVPGRYRGGEGDDPSGFLGRNLAITTSLLEAARHAGVARVILMSSRAVFGHRPGDEDPTDPVGDQAATRPDSLYGVLKVAEEALASAWTARDGAGAPTICALRPTGIYGMLEPAADSKWFPLAESVRDGRPVAPRRATEVHGIDLAAAALHLLEAPAGRIAGRAFNCSDLDLDRRELVRELAVRLGVQTALPAPAPAPRNPMRCDALAALGWRPGGRARLAQDLDALAAAVRSAGGS